MMLYLTFQEFRKILKSAIESDRLWPELRQFDWYMERTQVGQGGVKLILP